MTEEELIPVDASSQEERRLTPAEAQTQLKAQLDEIAVQQEENRAALLNAASLLWRELRAEALELAVEAGRDPKAPLKREAIFKLLPEVELRENNIFQLSNIQSSTQKKLTAVERLL